MNNAGDDPVVSGDKDLSSFRYLTRRKVSTRELRNVLNWYVIKRNAIEIEPVFETWLDQR